tara:strand:- start:391 stop:558 length:168 start_codon:yes stop_codon:yes gene_type:complete
MKTWTVLHVMLPHTHAVGFAAEPSVTAHTGAEQDASSAVQINPVNSVQIILLSTQ